MLTMGLRLPTFSQALQPPALNPTFVDEISSMLHGGPVGRVLLRYISYCIEIYGDDV